MVCAPPASTSPGPLVNRQISGAHPRLMERNFLEVESENGIFIGFPRNSDAICWANSSPTSSFYKMGKLRLRKAE